MELPPNSKGRVDAILEELNKRLVKLFDPPAHVWAAFVPEQVSKLQQEQTLTRKALEAARSQYEEFLGKIPEASQSDVPDSGTTAAHQKPADAAAAAPAAAAAAAISDEVHLAAAKEDSKTKASGSNKQKGKAVSSKARKKPVLCCKARGNAKDTTLQERYAKVIKSIAKKVARTEPLAFKRNKSPWTRNNTCVFCVGVCKECGTHLYAGPWAKAHTNKWGSVQRL